MSDITLSKAVRSNLLSLQNTANLMSKTQERLATGKKVNSALDNPTNFFTASGLNSRAGDINQLLDGMANGIQTLEAADNGLKAITKTLESMQSTLRQARQDKSFQTSSMTLDRTAIGTDTLKSLTFSGGAVGTTPVNIALNSVETTPAVQGTATFEYTAPAAGTQSTVTADNDFTNIDLSNDAGDRFNFNVTLGSSTANISLAPGDGTAGVIDIDQAITAIQAQLDAQEVAVTVGKDGDKLTFTANDAGAQALTIAGGAVVDGEDDGNNNQSIDDLGIANLGGAGQTDTGDAVGSYSITINDEEITLTGANAATATAAASHINSVLSAAGIDVVATGDNDNGTISFVGSTDGATAIEIGSDGDEGTAFTNASDVVAAVAGSGDAGVQTVDQLVNTINSSTALNGAIRASNDNGKLRIENLSTQTLTIGGYNATSAKVDGSTGTGSSTTIGGNTVRADLADQFNELRDQLDKLADDASFNGINLLRGDNLQITFNETGTSEINIRTKNGETINSANLGVPTTLTAADLDSDSTIDGFLASVKSGINEVRSQSSAFGSSLSIVQNRQDFSKNMINTLQTGAANLTLADANEEAANLLALQTRQQLSSTALSMASQADQAVLRLF